MPKKFIDLIDRVADFKSFVDENGDLIFKNNSSLIESGDLDGGTFSLNRAYLLAKTESIRNFYPRSLNHILTTYSESSGSSGSDSSGNTTPSGNSKKATSTGNAGNGTPYSGNNDDATAAGTGSVNTNTTEGKKKIEVSDPSNFQVGDVIIVGDAHSAKIETVTIISIDGDTVTVDPPFENDHTGKPIKKKGNSSNDWYQNDVWGWYWVDSSGDWIYSNKYSTWIFVGRLTE